MSTEPEKQPKEKRVFGHIPGVEVGQEFSDREALAEAGVHKPLVAGISGGKEGADSIVLAAGYEDDEDFGDVIIYTGAGGREPNSSKHTKDQELKSVNLALAKSSLEGLPVRVVRGYKHKSEWSPESGYRYCGLYRVDDYWHEKGKAGFIVWRYRLVPFNEEVFEASADSEDTQTDQENETRRVTTTVQRIVRDTKIAKRVKEMYNYECQVCGTTIETSAGRYAEAAHIKPLGKPHNGPDVESNILCLCPNHHVMFDNGGFAIEDDLTLIGINGILTLVKQHKINLEMLSYHRNKAFF